MSRERTDGGRTQTQRGKTRPPDRTALQRMRGGSNTNAHPRERTAPKRPADGAKPIPPRTPGTTKPYWWLPDVARRVGTSPRGVPLPAGERCQHLQAILEATAQNPWEPNVRTSLEYAKHPTLGHARTTEQSSTERLNTPHRTPSCRRHPARKHYCARYGHPGIKETATALLT